MTTSVREAACPRRNSIHAHARGWYEGLYAIPATLQPTPSVPMHQHHKERRLACPSLDSPFSTCASCGSSRKVMKCGNARATAAAGICKAERANCRVTPFVCPKVRRPTPRSLSLSLCSPRAPGCRRERFPLSPSARTRGRTAEKRQPEHWRTAPAGGGRRRNSRRGLHPLLDDPRIYP